MLAGQNNFLGKITLQILGELFNITFSAECCLFLCATLLLDEKTGIWKRFKSFFLYILIAEVVGWYMSDVMGIENNNWVFNILLIYTGGFTIWILSQADPFIRTKRKLKKGIILYLLFALTNMAFFEGFRNYNAYTEMILDLIVCYYCCYFFYKTLEEPEYRNLYRYEFFWLAVGFLFSSLGSAILYIFISSLTSFSKHTHIDIYGYINSGLNVVLYSSLIISFICRRKNTRLSPV